MAEENFVVSIDEDLKEIIPLYFENSREEIEELRRALQKRGYEDLIRLGHGIKGSSQGYGFDDMGEIGARIERAARSESEISQIELLVDELENYLNRVEVVYV